MVDPASDSYITVKYPPFSNIFSHPTRDGLAVPLNRTCGLLCSVSVFDLVNCPTRIGLSHDRLIRDDTILVDFLTIKAKRLFSHPIERATGTDSRIHE